jgi:hypothetical protein
LVSMSLNTDRPLISWDLESPPLLPLQFFRFRYLRAQIQVSSSSDDTSCLHVPKHRQTPHFLRPGISSSAAIAIFQVPIPSSPNPGLLIIWWYLLSPCP